MLSSEGFGMKSVTLGEIQLNEYAERCGKRKVNTTSAKKSEAKRETLWQTNVKTNQQVDEQEKGRIKTVAAVTHRLRSLRR